MSGRINREKKTVEAMIGLYCSARHGSAGGLCADCRELLEYAFTRLDKCPFQEGKTTCGKCRVHCYKPAMREKIKKVMRFSGPKIAVRRPVLALRHLVDGLRKEAVKKKQV